VVERQRGVGIAAGHLLSSALAEAIERAGIPTRLYPDALSMKWSKMLTNLPANASAAILDMTPGEILAHAGLFRMEMEILREALRVMKAVNYHVMDLPGVPVRGLAFAASKLPLPIAQLILRRGLGAGRGGKMPSFHIDLHSGKGRSEVDSLNGAVVRFAEANNLNAPVNQVLTETLLRLTRGEEVPADYARQPEKLLKLAGYA
jgi:2-dehydropantoate 2-reductase